MSFMETVGGARFANSVNEIARYFENKDSERQYVLRFQSGNLYSESSAIYAVTRTIVENRGEIVSLTTCHDKEGECYIVIYKAMRNLAPLVEKLSEVYVF